MDKIQSLKNQLDYHDNLYYNQDSPELSDAEYDALKKEYLKLTNQQEYNYVPGEAQFKKFTHTFPIKSLSKINTLEEARKEIERLYPVVIEPKYDGLTIVIYPEGKAVTRGSGTIGEDVTSNVVKFARVNHSYGYPIRGEAIMPISVFNEINKQREVEGKELFKNPRNAIAGILRNKDNSNIPKGLRFIAYEIVGSAESHIQQLLELKKYYDIPEADTIWNYSDIDDAVKFIENFDRSKLDYEIDGLVIKSNKVNALDIFGETEHHPNHNIAYKFPSQGEWTVLKSITWQTGRTGRITPVAELEPVDIMGSTIERATLHNIGYISGLDLQLYDKVFLVKSNDIIPAVIKCEHTKNSKPIEIINKCPSCGGSLKVVNDQLFCYSFNCQAKLLYRTTHLVKRDALNIDGLSKQTILKMIEAGYINEPWDIFDVTEAQILKLDGFAKKSAKKIYENIHNARNCDFDRAIYASGIELVGKKVSKDIAKEFGSYEELINSKNISNGNLANRLYKIEGIGHSIVESFVDNFDQIEKLISYLNIKQPEKKDISITDNPFSGKKIYGTGTFANYKKDELKWLLEHMGAEFTSGYAKSLDYLIVGSVKGSSKEDKAKKDGVKILTEDEFLKMIGG